MSFAPSSGWGSGAATRTCARPPGRAVEIVGLVFLFIYMWPAGVAYIAWKFMGYPMPSVLRRFGEGNWAASFRDAGFRSPSFRATGNRAFDEYRRAEIDRLEAERRKLDDEAKSFRDFVDELKRAKDREEFDAYMARRRGSDGTTAV